MLNVFREGAKTWVSKLLIWFVAFTFVGAAFLVWGRGSESYDDAVALVGEEPISKARFFERKRQTEDLLRTQLGGQVDYELIKALNAPALALNALIESSLQVIAARDAGLMVTDTELQDIIVSMPEFGYEGNFDSQRYIETLQRNGLTPRVFEASLKNDILANKLKSMVERAAYVSDVEVYNRYLFDYQPVIVDYVKVNAKDMIDKVEVDSNELTTWFNDHQGEFVEPESRAFRMLHISPDALTEKTTLSDADLEEYYNNHLPEFEIQEKVSAKHILAKLSASATDVENMAAKEKVIQARARIEAGEDFADVAKDVSEGPSAQTGGDLGSFARGMMVPEFENVVFEQEVGVVSEPFKSDFGWHIAVSTAHTQAKTPTLDEVKEKVTKKAMMEKLRYDARLFMEELKGEILPNSFAAITDKHPEVKINTHEIKKGELALVMDDPVVTEETVFDIEPKMVSEVITLNDGFAIVMVDSIEPPHTPKLDKIRADVEQKYKMQAAMKLAELAAGRIEKAVNEGEDIADAAKAEGLNVKTTKPFSRVTLSGHSGVNEDGMSLDAFELAEGEAKSSLSAGGYLTMIIASRAPLHEENIDEKLAELHKGMKQRKAERLFAEYMANIREKAEKEGKVKILIDLEQDI